MVKKISDLHLYIRTILLEAESAGIGVPQNIGIGYNYHTVNPEPITWENYPGLDFEINAEPDGSVYAKVNVLDHPEMSTPTRKFADNDTAMFWVRKNYDEIHRRLMTIDEKNK